jgi:hypothetical protein
VRALCQQLAAGIGEGRDVEARGMLALALGCIHRAKGGMALQQVRVCARARIGAPAPALRPAGPAAPALALPAVCLALARLRSVAAGAPAA